MRPVVAAARLVWPAVLGGVVVLSCTTPTGACGCSPPENAIVGTWTATQLNITPTGQAPIDALAAGGTLTIAISGSTATTGTLSLPASVTGGAPLNASMAGRAFLSSTGTEVTFTQTADTFVRDLTWQRVGNTSLRVSNQVAGGASFTVILTRQ